MDIDLFEKAAGAVIVGTVGTMIAGLNYLGKKLAKMVSKEEVEQLIEEKMILAKQEMHNELKLIHYELSYIKEILEQNFEFKIKKS